MGEDELGAAGVEFSRRRFVQRMLGAAFVAPVVASFALDSLASASPTPLNGNQTCGNQGPPVSVHIGSISTLTEGRVAHLPVTLSIPAPFPIAIDYHTQDGPGPGPAASATQTPIPDYTAASGTLWFNCGDQEKNIDVQTLKDGIVEPAEKFQVVISTTTPGVTFTKDRADVFISKNSQ